MWGAGVKMGGIAGLQQMLFALEYELDAPRQHVEPFLTFVLIEFLVMPVGGNLDCDRLQISERAATGNRAVAESVCRPRERTVGANHGASRGLLVAVIEQRANRNVVDLPQRDQRGQRRLARPSLQPREIRLG